MASCRYHLCHATLSSIFVIFLLYSLRHLNSQSPRHHHLTPQHNEDHNHAFPTVIFVCTKRDSTSWIANSMSFIPPDSRIIYVADDQTAAAPYHPPRNHGNEAMSYLSYLIDHYSALPPEMIFLHCHPETYHNNVRFNRLTAPMVQRLNHTYVRDRGFVNLLCDEAGWPSSSCEDGLRFRVQLFSDDPERFARRVPSSVRRHFLKHMVHVLQHVHPGRALPPVVSAPRGAQFAVTRETVRTVPLETLVWVRDWIMTSELDSHFVGQVLENLWHVLFLGPESGVLCPVEDTCYCALYGSCA